MLTGNARKVGEVGMKEYIVQAIAQETIRTFEEHNAPEIVRYKDCKYVECEGVEGFLVCDMSGFSHSPDFYCADGERRE